jgi:flagellar biogenesis protein FliO
MEVATTLRQIFSILLVFLLLGFAVWKLRNSSRAFAWPWRRDWVGSRALQAVERLALTPNHTLHLVRFHGCEVVVATHPQGCTILGEKSAGIRE